MRRPRVRHRRDHEDSDSPAHQSSSESIETPAAKRSSYDNSGSSRDNTSSTRDRMKRYKHQLKYNPEWAVKWQWMQYDEQKGGMICTCCKKFGRPPVVSRGAWVSRPINNWVKATKLLDKHSKSEWHLASVEAQVLADSAKQSGNVVERMDAASEIDRKKNRELIKKLARSLYFLVKHRMPHTTTFEDLIHLQVENGNQQLEVHLQSAPLNATYLSKISTAELLSCISSCIEESLLARLNSSQFISIMADESSDVSSKEELSICGRWLEDGTPVEHFLGILHAREVNAEALTDYLLQFLSDKGISVKRVRGLGFDGTNTMSGKKNGVQIRMRCHAPSALYIHCRCHQLQLAVVHAADEHKEVKRVLGSLLTIWKTFYYSPKKAEKLVEIQAVLEAPELKIHKPSDTRWLARERCVRAVRRSLPALIRTFDEIYEENGDAEAYGLAKLLRKYKFVACLYMLCDVLHTLAKLQGSLQAKQLNLATVPVMVENTISRLKELKEDPKTSTWFKDHTDVFKELMGDEEISEDEGRFNTTVYRPYIQGIIDHISSRLDSKGVFSAFSLFDPRHLPTSEDSLAEYGEDKLDDLITFYGNEQKVVFEGKAWVSTPDIDKKETESEWKMFRRVLFSQYKSSTDDLQVVTSRLLTDSTLNAAFPNLATLASLQLVLPVTTATVERSFSDMKLVKTRLRSRLGENTLDQAMRVCIEGPPTLSEDELDNIVTLWKDMKPRRLSV